MFTAPTMLTRLVHAPAIAAADLRNLRTIFYGGGPMCGLRRPRSRFAAFLGGTRLSTVTSDGRDRRCHPMTMYAGYQETQACEPRWGDEEGFLTLRDRSKDVIISGGTNIYPREVEEVLLRHPDLVEVSVVGRPHPEWGEEVAAFVVGRPAAKVAPEELDRLCLDHIARFKRPRHYRFVDALPKNNYGKVLKTELRRILAQ